MLKLNEVCLTIRREEVSKFVKNAIITIILISVIVLFQGRTKPITVTIDDANDSFQQYLVVVSDFIEEPTKDKIPQVSRSGGTFISHYYDLVAHQTLYNRLLKIEPLLSSEEMKQLEELKDQERSLDKQYVEVALTDVFQASDFSSLIDEAMTNGSYHSDYINIQKTVKNKIHIEIEGTFSAKDTPNIFTRYFLIETEAQNYYWERPTNYSMSLDKHATRIKVGKMHYDISAKVTY